MQAAHPETSKLTVNFGEKHGAIMPLNLELVIELFSQQVTTMTLSNNN